MKKLLIAVIAILVSTDISAYCGPFKELCCVTTPVKCHEKYENLCYKEPCSPMCGWFIDAEFLYWNINQRGLTYGPSIVREILVDSVITTEFSKITEKQISSQWQPGFRIGVGNERAWNSWDVEIYWTNINSSTTSRIDDNNSLKWDFNFNTIEGYFIRDFRYAMIDFRPYAGVRGAFIGEKAHIFDLDTFIPLVGAPIPVIVDQHNKQNFTGIGPLLGLKAEFTFCHCYSVYANVSGSALFGRFRVKCSQRDTIRELTDRSDTHRNPCRCQGVLDAGAGFSWGSTFYKDRIALVMSVGYEYHCYFNHDFIGNDGNLTLQGLTISAKTFF